MPSVNTNLWRTPVGREEDGDDSYIDMLEKGFSKDLITEACSSPTPK